MPKPTLTFKYPGHTKRNEGLIAHYHLEVTDNLRGKIVTISVEPKHPASTRSIKRILLDLCMPYRTTRAEHDKMLQDS